MVLSLDDNVLFLELLIRRVKPGQFQLGNDAMRSGFEKRVFSLDDGIVGMEWRAFEGRAYPHLYN